MGQDGGCRAHPIQSISTTIPNATTMKRVALRLVAKLRRMLAYVHFMTKLPDVYAVQWGWKKSLANGRTKRP